MSANDDSYARSIAQQIQEDIDRQRAIGEAINRDEERLLAVEAELKNIKPRLNDNHRYHELLQVHIPYRIRALELLCADQGWNKPEFRRVGERNVVGAAQGGATGQLVRDRSPIGDMVAAEVRAGREPVAAETVAYLMRPEEGSK